MAEPSSSIESSLSTFPLLPLPPPFHTTVIPPTLIYQGAESLLFKTTFLLPSLPCALKYRPSKQWRHPTLDARLTRHRILSEARILVKCRREGVKVPGVLALDWEGGEFQGRKSGGWMMMEWVEGATVRDVLSSWLKWKKAEEQREGEERQEGTVEDEAKKLMQRIGRVLGRLHEIGVVHGDLTTSNLMLRPTQVLSNGHMDADKLGRPSLEGEVVLIDFGLAQQSVQDEDKAVDLYVLERAFGSTHPTAEHLFQEVLGAYQTSYKGAGVVLKRLEDVRMRGRKRSMLG